MWTLVDGLNESLANVGFAVIALFAIAWLASIVLYRRMFSDDGRRSADAVEGFDATEAVVVRRP